jgi:hypothetical protein
MPSLTGMKPDGVMCLTDERWPTTIVDYGGSKGRAGTHLTRGDSASAKRESTPQGARSGYWLSLPLGLEQRNGITLWPKSTEPIQCQVKTMPSPDSPNLISLPRLKPNRHPLCRFLRTHLHAPGLRDRSACADWLAPMCSFIGLGSSRRSF